MAMTREERNKARSAARFGMQQREYDDKLIKVMKLYQNAPRLGMSHENILAELCILRSEPSWMKLPKYWHIRLDGAVEVLFKTLHNNLVYTHIVNSVRVPHKEVPDNQLRGLNTKYSAHCYVIDGRYIPFSEKYRVLASDYGVGIEGAI